MLNILNDKYCLFFSEFLIEKGLNLKIKQLKGGKEKINKVQHKLALIKKQKLFSILIQNHSNSDLILQNISQSFTARLQQKSKKVVFSQLKKCLISHSKKRFFFQRSFFIKIKLKIKRRKTGKSLQNLVGFWHKKKLMRKAIKGFKFDVRCLKEKIGAFKRRADDSVLRAFLNKCVKRTVESLIVQGVREKYNIYKKRELLKQCFVVKIERLKLKKCVKNVRIKYSKKLGITLLKNNVELMNKEMMQRILFYYRIFIMRINNQKMREEKFEIKCFLNTIKLNYFLFVMNIKSHIKARQKLKEISIISEIIDKRMVVRKLAGILHKKKTAVYFKSKIKYFYYRLMTVKIKEGVRLKNKLKQLKKQSLHQIFTKLLSNRISKSSIRKLSNKITILKHQNLLRVLLSYTRKRQLKSNFLLKATRISYKFYVKNLIDSMIFSYKMKIIEENAYNIYIKRRKNAFLRQIKKRYQDQIKGNMLLLRYKEYLVIKGINGLLGAVDKRRGRKSVDFNEGDRLKINN